MLKLHVCRVSGRHVGLSLLLARMSPHTAAHCKPSFEIRFDLPLDFVVPQ